MGWTQSVLVFAGGAVAKALIDQLVDRTLAAPRVDCAIADLSISRSRVRAHKAIPATDNLRRLLADGPTQTVDWDARFLSEQALELSLLELVEREETCRRDCVEIERLLGQVGTVPAREFVLTLGRNRNLLSFLVEALVCAPPPRPSVPEAPQRQPVVFPLVEKQVEKDGQDLVFVHLDLPGNPFPVVGSRSGRPELNTKAGALAYSLSVCDTALLSQILTIGRNHANQQVQEATNLRAEFEAIRHQATYLQVRLAVANRGKTSAYLSTTARLTVGRNAPVALSVVDFDEKAESQPTSTLIRDWASRLADWAPNLVPLVEGYQSVIRYITLDSNDCQQLLFVSDSTVSTTLRDAINAIRTGHAKCTIELSQYTPRRTGWLGLLNRFEKRIKVVQSLRRS